MNIVQTDAIYVVYCPMADNLFT